MLTLDLIPAGLSVLGALLVARYDRWSGLGWLCWLASNGMWIAWGVAGTGDGQMANGVVLQNIIFLGTSMTGLAKWRRHFAIKK